MSPNKSLSSLGTAEMSVAKLFLCHYPTRMDLVSNQRKRVVCCQDDIRTKNSKMFNSKPCTDSKEHGNQQMGVVQSRQSPPFGIYFLLAMSKNALSRCMNSLCGQRLELKLALGLIGANVELDGKKYARPTQWHFFGNKHPMFTQRTKMYLGQNAIPKLDRFTDLPPSQQLPKPSQTSQRTFEGSNQILFRNSLIKRWRWHQRNLSWPWKQICVFGKTKLRRWTTQTKFGQDCKPVHYLDLFLDMPDPVHFCDIANFVAFCFDFATPLGLFPIPA